MPTHTHRHTHEPKHPPTRGLEIEMRIRHIELVDAEGENFLSHLLGVVGLELRVNGLQKGVRTQSRSFPDKDEVGIIQLKAIDLVTRYPDFAAQEIAIKLPNLPYSDRAAKTAKWLPRVTLVMFFSFRKFPRSICVL